MFKILKRLFKSKIIKLDTIELPIFHNDFGYMNYTQFKITGTNLLTNKKKSMKIDAKSKNEAIEIAKNDNFEEPFSIEIIPFKKPSERQLNYIRDLNVHVPDNVCLDDISCMISRMVDNDKLTPNTELVEYAYKKGVKFSKFIGKKDLYNSIYFSLELRDKIAFFAFCVYRWACENRHANLNTSPHKKLFYDFSENNLTNESFVKSLDNYRGEDIRFFGKLETKDGYTLYGGSTRTLAFKTCIEFLKKNFNIKQTHFKKLQN